MTKGADTRQEILDHAVGLAALVGLDGLTIGRLASDLDLSKSGLFAHFNSKEGLQIQVLDEAARRFTDIVVRPSQAARPGIDRLTAVFENWMKWGVVNVKSGGCIFVAAAVELDDQPGPVRDRLVYLQGSWIHALAEYAREAIAAGDFDKSVAPNQFAQDFFGIMLSCHFFARLLHDRDSVKKARHAFETLLSTCAAGRKAR